ncbi:hypothetical protein B0T21DRAFT_352060 [Apiosordaria backusii]|uniref:Cyanovirin-N domain-containing protein n=1 Tax=Apiosordaria backusii TaxID=314023 RepID=A0AA40AIU4_9PEZI|nr:hypothetical protein B0T21DRAFT_352060 [Apiosordaria backusii]
MFALPNFFAIWLLSSILSLTTAQYTQKWHSFSKTCTNITLTDNWFLNATCLPLDPSQHVPINYIPLDLNLCITMNETGQLDWDLYGKASNYCNNCTLALNPGCVDLTCTCGADWGFPSHNTTINLDEGIGNYDGQVVCRTTGPIDPPVTRL